MSTLDATLQVAYGINTGFGNFANVIIPNDELCKLQRNLIRSHAAGVGEPIKPNQTRMLMILRANVFAKGHSGIRPVTLRHLLAALNKNCLPLVPSKGTVGASGDLAPLSHLALGLMGEGRMWDPADETFKPAAAVLAAHGLEAIELQAKEGLALINGTQFMTAIGCEALVRAQRVAVQADVIAALTLEALHGSSRPFHPAVHAVRPHSGQLAVAGRLRALLNFGRTPSQIMRSHVNCGKVQDSYTMRCVPQIHGVSHDTIAFVAGILETECNSATDNPMIFADIPSATVRSRAPSDGSHGDGSAVDAATVEAVRARIHSASVGAHLDCAAPHHFDHHSHAHSHEHAHGHGHSHGHSHGNVESSDASASASASASSSASTAEADPLDDEDMGVIISGGNFHGEYPAKALDFLAIGVAELGSVAERRIERLVNPHLSALPAFLVKQGGLNSGYMIAHCTAAALVSENKVLCHPSSVDSLSTSAAQEDHVRCASPPLFRSFVF
jgi:histidine ammonia-lyase